MWNKIFIFFIHVIISKLGFEATNEFTIINYKLEIQ